MTVAGGAGEAAPGSFAGTAPAEPDEAFAVELSLGDAGSGRSSRLAVSRGLGLQGRFGLSSVDPEAADDLIGQAAFGSPFLALADRGDGLAMAQEVGPETQFRLGILRADGAEQEPFERGRTALVVGELVQRFGSGGALTFQVGTVEEQESLLASRSGGALGLPNQALTTFAGMTARWGLGPRLALFGQGSLGLTEPGGAGQGLFEDVSALTSSSFAAGLTGRGLLVARDRLTLAIAQPLRVEAGSATLDRPVGRSFDEQILRRSEQVDLAPAGRELDLEVGYRLALGPRQQLSLNWLTRLEPGHRQDTDPDHALAIRLRTRF
jgi:hypothetical protein